MKKVVRNYRQRLLKSSVKGLGWGTIASCVTGGLLYWQTGEWEFAAGIASLDRVIKLVLFPIYDMVTS